MADTTERLPFPISRRLAGQIETLNSRGGREIHYAIGGVPFRTAISSDLPMTISTTEIRKQQQDTEPEAGEQSLSDWWYRSQASWHEGAGAQFAEARGEVADSARFWESSNVDVWTPGEIQLLKRPVPITGTVHRSVAAVPDASVYTVVSGQVGFVQQFINIDLNAVQTTLYVGAGVTFSHVLATETEWFAAGNDGRVYAGNLGVTTADPKVWSLTDANTGKPTRILWAKHRLWAVNGNKIYNIAYGTPGTVGAPTGTTAIYPHPSTAWTYTDLADGPNCIYFSGHGDGTSGLQRVTLDPDGAVPTLSGAIVTAVLPSDEKALRIASLASSLVCIATNRGVRVAAVQASGELVYGPLFMERADLNPNISPALVSAGRWWWLTWGDQPKCWRIDSSTEVEEGVFAYASDMEQSSDNYKEIAVRGERPVVTTVSGSLAYRHSTELAETGFLTSGRIRYRTDEPKAFRFINVTASPLAGTIVVDALTDTDTEQRLVTYNEPGQSPLPPSEFPIDLGTQRYISVKLTLQRGSPATAGPTVYGLLVKAVPAPKPQRLIQLPLACYDREKWSTGQEDGFDGFAAGRYAEMRTIEDAGGVTILQDFTLQPPLAEVVRIEEMKFVRTTQPNMEKFNSSFGGILLVTLRTLS